MPGNNAMSAGNQQERLDANWVVGFVDGEGCFHVGMNRQPKMRLGWQVLPDFRVVNFGISGNCSIGQPDESKNESICVENPQRLYAGHPQG